MNQGIDPRTGAPVGEPVPDTDLGRVRALTTAARSAAGWLARLPFTERAALLRALAAALRAHDEPLVTQADSETALGLPRLTGELARTAAQLDLFAGVLDDGAFCEATLDGPDPAAVPPHTDLRRMLEPLGPVAVFAAGNFPFAFSVVGGDTASALAAGCPVVVKAHPSHPRLSVRTGEILAEALAEAGAPEGVLAVVHGREAGAALVTDPEITAVGFTGSTAGGRILFDLAASRPDPIPFYGELGSINPVVVTPAALAARGPEIADGLSASATLGTGQFCTQPGLVFVPRDAEFAARTGHAVQESVSAPMLDARVRDGYEAGLRALAALPGVQRAEPADSSTEAPPGGEYRVAGAVLTVDAADFVTQAAALTEECFGPVTVLVSYGTPAELHKALAQVPGSLTGTLHAEPGDPDAAEVFAALRDRVGRVVYNGWPTGVAVTWSQHHGGPWPATTSPLHTSVGATATRRFLRPVAYQDVPDELLPQALQDANPLGLPRRVNGVTRHAGT